MNKRLKVTSEDYCLYLRKSRADLELEARGEGETLLRHKKHLLALGKRMKINITHIYQELVSGDRISERPEAIKLLSDVEDGKYKGVLVMEVERLARGDTIDQGLVAQAFKRSGTLIVTPNKTYDPTNEFDEEYFEFGLFMARREYKTITRRLQRGREASASEGNYIGARPPYGYKLAYNDRLERYLEPDPDQSVIVKMIFDWYVNGIVENGEHTEMGAIKIARKLDEMGIPTYKAKSKWNFNVILQILRNEVYIGRIQWKKRVSRKVIDGKDKSDAQEKDKWIDAIGKHVPLIDLDMFKIVQAKLKENWRVPVKSGLKVLNPLAGVVMCGKCGYSMILKSFPKRRGKGYSLACNYKYCDSKSSNFDMIEDRILQSIDTYISHHVIESGKRKEKPNQSIQLQEQLLKQFKSELEQLESQKGTLFDFLERGVYDEATFLERSQNLSKRLQETQLRIDQTDKELNEKKRQVANRKDWIPTLKKALIDYRKSDDQQEKNKLMKSIISKVEYTKEKSQSGDQFTIKVFFRDE